MPAIQPGRISSDVPQGSVLFMLKDQTRDIHLQLEDRLNLLNLSDLQSYQTMLTAFASVYQHIEPQVFDRPEWQNFPDLQPERKLPWLQTDLDFFGLQGTELSHTLQFSDWQQVLGAVYVMEGSTLGGQLISRHLKTLDITPERGGRFFNGYQSRTGEMWKQTRHLLESQSTDPLQVVEGARITFECFYAGLS